LQTTDVPAVLIDTGGISILIRVSTRTGPYETHMAHRTPTTQALNKKPFAAAAAHEAPRSAEPRLKHT
jgi:hypothetical protein